MQITRREETVEKKCWSKGGLVKERKIHDDSFEMHCRNSDPKVFGNALAKL